MTNTLFINYANNAMRCPVGHETTIISGRIEPSAKVQYFTEMATDRYPISGGILNSLWTIPVRIQREATPKFTCVSPSRCPSTFRVTRASSCSSEISDLLLPSLLSRRYRICRTDELFIQFAKATRHRSSNLFANLEDFYCNDFL